MKKNKMYVELMRSGGKKAVREYNAMNRKATAGRPNQRIEDGKHKKEKHKVIYEREIQNDPDLSFL